MFRNSLKIAFRILWRNKGYSLINILGLAIGLCSSIIVYLYVQHEFGYDQFHDNPDRIYRFIMQEKRNGTLLEHPFCRLPLGPALQNDFPEIEQVVRTREATKDFVYENHVFSSDKIFYADTAFFQMFKFPLIEGNPDYVLQENNAIILSSKFARKIFGDIEPVGKTITSIYGDVFIVSGIALDPPTNTKFKFEGIMPIGNFVGDGSNFSWRGGPEFDTYVKIKKNVDPEKLKLKFLSFFDKYISGSETNGDLQPLKDMYFHSSRFSYSENDKHYEETILFAIISFFILFIAIINYVNLSTARSVKRAKEVGIKKVVGANRSALIKQFFAESYFIVLISILLALIFVEVFLPGINNFFNYKLSLYNLGSKNVILILILFFIVVGSLSALYPALFLSSFKPEKVLKGVLSAKRKSYFRSGLVVFQFVIASILISCTLYSVQQLNFIRNKPLGYNRNNLMVVKLTPSIRKKHEILKAELLNIPGIVDVSASSGYVSNSGFNGDHCKPEGKTNAINVRFLEADPDYIRTMGMNIVEGREFSNDLATDKDNCIINETLANMINWDDPINKKLGTFLGDKKIIGVLDDFHFRSLQSKIEPLVLTCNEFLGFYWLNIKLGENSNSSLMIEEVEKTIKKIDQSQPLIYSFLSDKYELVYYPEIKFGKIFQLFSFLAIFIACLGLFGLVAYTAQERTKEMGVRKVFGSSSGQLLAMLARDYFKIIIVANSIAIPVAIYLILSWQNNYAYFVPITITLFGMTILINFIIAICIIYLQSVKATTQNPVDLLRYE